MRVEEGNMQGKTSLLVTYGVSEGQTTRSDTAPSMIDNFQDPAFLHGRERCKYLTIHASNMITALDRTYQD
jgi:hypothetical protein